MRSRLLAGAVLLVSGLLAWLAVSSTVAARILQLLIGVSIVYVVYLGWVGWRTIRRALRERPSGPHERPWITVLVPARNEAAVIGAIVEDLGAQAYADEAGPRFDVVVVDDGSDDGTARIAAEAGQGLRTRLRVIRREPGSGPKTKGAVLAFADPHLRGSVLAVLDADTRVAPDYLTRALGAWRRDPTAAALQTRREKMNARRGWLPAAQEEEDLMDIASQCGRWATDGTAELRGTGMFLRRDALAAVGGWDEKAVTEDLELSTRLAAADEHIVLAPEAILHEEAVESLAALWRQRMRWAEGSIRRLIDHGPGLLVDQRLPIGRRLDFLLFLTEFVVPPLFVATIVASLITVALPRAADWTVPLTLFVGYGLGTFILAAAGLAAYGSGTPSLVGRATRGALFMSHWLVVIPIALLKIAVGPVATTFAQTPRVPRMDR